MGPNGIRTEAAPTIFFPCIMGEAKNSSPLSNGKTLHVVPEMNLESTAPRKDSPARVNSVFRSCSPVFVSCTTPPYSLITTAAERWVSSNR